MGRSGGGGFGGGGGFSGGGFGGGFSSGGGGFGGSFGGGSHSGGRSGGSDFGGSNYGGGGYYGGGGFFNGFLLGNLLGSSRGGGGGSYNPPPGYDPNGQGGNSGGPSNGGLNDPNSQKSNTLGCLVILIFAVALVFIISIFGGLVSCSGSGVPASTVERTALPANAAITTEYYEDTDGDWIHTPSKLEAGLREFHDETGVWPYVYILPNGETTSASELQQIAEDVYKENFTDDAHFVLVFCDNNSGGYNCGYYGGQAARSVMDDEAVQILAAYLEQNYNDYSISEEEIFSNTFSQTANHIMSKSINPVIPLAICIAVVVVAIIVALIIKRNRDHKKAEADRMEKILSTPLEQFSDTELDDLEKKYQEQPQDADKTTGQ